MCCSLCDAKATLNLFADSCFDGRIKVCKLVGQSADDSTWLAAHGITSVKEQECTKPTEFTEVLRNRCQNGALSTTCQTIQPDYVLAIGRGSQPAGDEFEHIFPCTR